MSAAHAHLKWSTTCASKSSCAVSCGKATSHMGHVRAGADVADSVSEDIDIAPGGGGVEAIA